MVIDFNETHEDVLVHMNYGIKGAGLEKEVDFFEKIEMSWIKVKQTNSEIKKEIGIEEIKTTMMWTLQIHWWNASISLFCFISERNVTFLD